MPISIAHRVLARFLSTRRVAMEFETEKAKRDYLREHPGADASKHSVVDAKAEAEPKSPELPKSLASDIKSDWVGSGLDRPGNPVTALMNALDKGKKVHPAQVNKALGVLKQVVDNAQYSKDKKPKLKKLLESLEGKSDTKKPEEKKPARKRPIDEADDEEKKEIITMILKSPEGNPEKKIKQLGLTTDEFKDLVRKYYGHNKSARLLEASTLTL